jgi:hypothetical protein
MRGSLVSVLEGYAPDHYNLITVSDWCFDHWPKIAAFVIARSKKQALMSADDLRGSAVPIQQTNMMRLRGAVVWIWWQEPPFALGARPGVDCDVSSKLN